MPDILTLWNTTRGDWQRDGVSLASGNDIVTSVLISLFTDRTAGVDDPVPDATRKLRDPRGWWADESIGSRLWLLERAKRTQETLQQAQAYIIEALQWLVDDGVASRIEVGVEWTRQNTLGAQIVVYSPRTGKPLVKIGTQNAFRLADAQAWGWNDERGIGQWVELRSSGIVPPVAYELDLDGVVNCGITPAVGKTVSGLIASATYKVTLPPGRLYKAWSYNKAEAGWNTRFYVLNADGSTSDKGFNGAYSTADAAYAAYPGAQFTGSEHYTFWLPDPIPSDNLGGLSLLFTNA